MGAAKLCFIGGRVSFGGTEVVAATRETKSHREARSQSAALTLGTRGKGGFGEWIIAAKITGVGEFAATEAKRAIAGVFMERIRSRA